MKPRNINFDEYNSMVEQYHSESDRGADVLAGSHVENVLGMFLKYKMTNLSKEDTIFDSNGPLSTFSNRITIAQAFGFIREETADSLNFIRKIRNYFAHHPFEANFDESPVREWITQLRRLLSFGEHQADVKKNLKGRHVYLISCGMFIGSSYAKMIKKPNQQL